MGHLKLIADWVLKSNQMMERKAPRIAIHTLDNPGWTIIIHLEDTELDKREFAVIDCEKTNDDWVYCKKEDNKIKGYCGPLNLLDLIDVFLIWSGCLSLSNTTKHFGDISIIELMKWYESQCDEHWEHCYGMHLYANKNTGWEIHINFTETDLEDMVFKPIKKSINKEDWIDCYTEKNIFKGTCGLLNLEEVISIFVDWTKM